MDYGDEFATGDARRNVYLAINDLYCGCGNPDSAVELIHDLLKAAPFYEHRESGTIGGSWLTPLSASSPRGDST